jgi:hypothetical protein
LGRLHKALEGAAKMTGDISKIFEQAEEEAGNALNPERGGGGGGGGGRGRRGGRR